MRLHRFGSSPPLLLCPSNLLLPSFFGECSSSFFFSFSLFSADDFPLFSGATSASLYHATSLRPLFRHAQLRSGTEEKRRERKGGAGGKKGKAGSLSSLSRPSKKRREKSADFRGSFREKAPEEEAAPRRTKENPDTRTTSVLRTGSGIGDQSVRVRGSALPAAQKHSPAGRSRSQTPSVDPEEAMSDPEAPGGGGAPAAQGRNRRSLSFNVSLPPCDSVPCLPLCGWAAWMRAGPTKPTPMPIHAFVCVCE